MSTRCNIVVRHATLGSDLATNTYLYHHTDGYPNGGVGWALKSYLSEHWKHDFQWRQYPVRMIDELIKGKVDQDTTYELTFGLHEDIDYLYVIDTFRHSLRCYKIYSGDIEKYKTVEGIEAYCEEVEISQYRHCI